MAITYPDGTKVSYEYDPNGNLTKVTGRRREVTTYEYDALNRPVVEHRPNGISTYKTYNARNQIVELTNQCDDCGWVLGYYVYTYDNRGYIVGEHAEEAREMDPYGRERYTPYAPEEQGENCDHGKNKSLSYRLLTTDSAFTYDDAGKLLTAMEAEAGCSTATVWTYSYDLVGNLTEKAQYKVEKTLLEGMEETQNGGNSFSNGEEAPDETANSQKGTGDLSDGSLSAQDRGNGSTNNASLSDETIKFNNSTQIFDIVSKIDAVSREKYAYNENNQLSEAMICDGKTTKKVCYTYDEDGNLLTEYSPTDRSQTSYQYTIEDRLEAVYKGNAYNKTLQMAATYDGDGNRVYQINYNPNKDEDFSDYYCSYQNCDYNGTGIQLQASGEVSQAEKDLMALIGVSGAVRNSSYELIEYINDVNREYTEVLVEQNINGRIDTVYTYGNERISREMFQQTSRTAYYLYDPRGSVSGLADAKAHLTKTHRYSANGELTYGGARYENEYTYNGESYNPNIRSQYLRARYYSVTSARFLTEDSYLGNIAEPLTLNRYNYCVSSWLNYQDPSGYWIYEDETGELFDKYNRLDEKTRRINETPKLSQIRTFLSAMREMGRTDVDVDYVVNYNYRAGGSYVRRIEELAQRKNETYACEIFHVTLDQLERFGWQALEGKKDNYIVKFNRILNKYGITKSSSITMFMATMAHESNFGTDNIEGMRGGKETLTADNWDAYIAKVNPDSSMEFDERGAGYIQLSWKDTQKAFLENIGAYDDMLNSGVDRVRYIAANYSLEASAWFWGTTKVIKTGVGSLNDYADVYGNTEGIFLITQYFVNGFTARNEDLEIIRNGGEYEIKNGRLIVGDHSNPLPKNWEDRSEKYNKAYEIFR